VVITIAANYFLFLTTIKWVFTSIC